MSFLLGGGGGHQQPAPQSDPLGGLGSILGAFGGGNQQPVYQPSGGYGGYQQGGGGYPGGAQGSQGSDLLSNLGSALGSSLLSSAIDGFSKRKDVSKERKIAKLAQSPGLKWRSLFS